MDQPTQASLVATEADASAIAALRTATASTGRADCVGVHWHSVWGMPMTPEEWDDPQSRCVAALMETDAGHGAAVVLFNASGEDATFTLPKEDQPRIWTVRVDTRTAEVPPPDALPVEPGTQYVLPAHSMAILTATSHTVHP